MVTAVELRKITESVLHRKKAVVQQIADKWWDEHHGELETEMINAANIGYLTVSPYFNLPATDNYNYFCECIKQKVLSNMAGVSVSCTVNAGGLNSFTVLVNWSSV